MRTADSLVAVLGALLLSGLPAAAASQKCRDDVVFLRHAAGTAQFTVEIADDSAERALGLMNRPSLARSAGMLFVYDEPVDAVFWMKNVEFPLDMLFADESGTVTYVHRMAQPRDETLIPGGSGVRYVLEIAGGMADALGLDDGAELRHPAIPAEVAAWPCDQAHK